MKETQESCFLATPGCANAFAEKMKEALGNPEHARLIGKNGKR